MSGTTFSMKNMTGDLYLLKLLHVFFQSEKHVNENPHLIGREKVLSIYKLIVLNY
uniref:hypothetical protein n=1 Tax=Catalinimonas locisalis TaxID=3133978 RepID=UPI0031014B38